MKETKFKSKQWVLGRNYKSEKWELDIFSRYNKKSETEATYKCIGYDYYQCIPYEGNEQLLGTTNKPEAPKWKPKEGDFYYTIRIDLDTIIEYKVNRFIWSEDGVDTFTEENGLVFQTEEEAQKLCNKLNEAIKNVLDNEN